MTKRQKAACLLASLIVAIPSAMHAEDDCMPCYKPRTILCDDQVCYLYAEYAGTQLNCGWDVYGWGEFLYWSPSRETVALMFTNEGDPLGSRTQFHSQTFGYRPAFRVGIGTVAHCFDDWMFNIDYTWYHHSFRKTFSRAAPITIATSLGFFEGDPIYRSIVNSSKYRYDIVGVNVQRPNYFGQRVIISPFLGLKWLKRSNRISQDLIQAAGGLIDRQHATLAYTSIGMGIGFDGSWLFCWGLRMIGKADMALLFPYHRRFFQKGIAADGTILTLKHHARHISILGKGGMGFGWGDYFCCNRFHVDLSATYDYFVDLSQLDRLNGMFDSINTVLFSGLTIRAQLDF